MLCYLIVTEIVFGSISVRNQELKKKKKKVHLLIAKEQKIGEIFSYSPPRFFPSQTISPFSFTKRKSSI